MSQGQIHIAGPTMRVGSIRRQRCAWCGALLEEYDLARVARPLEPGEDPENPEPWEPASLSPGALYRLEGSAPRVTTLVEPDVIDGEAKLPEGACGLIDPAITT